MTLLDSTYAHPAFALSDLGSDVSYADARAQMQIAASHAQVGRPALLLCEHRPTVTYTRSGGTDSFLSPVDTLRDDGIDVVQADRGGDVTFHGPGQLVGYPVVGLTAHGAPRAMAVDYVRALETGLIAALSAFGLDDAHTRPGLTGVWLPGEDGDAEKIISIGVGMSPRGVTRHGFALNLDIDLDRYTRHIVPCGLIGHAMTTLKARMANPPSMGVAQSTVAAAVTQAIAGALGLDTPAQTSVSTVRTLLGATNG